MEELAKSIVTKWKELKDIKSNTRMQTVRWKLNIKQYEVPDEREINYKKNYDIGLSQVEDSTFSNNDTSQAIN